ncbi:3'-5' exoribonuclease domain-containing protein [Vibrio harveyi]|nr:3'-5' exoribonuclease [Vibrio harveyi]
MSKEIQQFDSLGLDYETLETATNCKVLSVGVVPFNKGEQASFDELRNRESSLYVKFLLSGQEKYDLVESEDTLIWWEKQGEAARFVIQPADHDLELPEAMQLIADHIIKWVQPIVRNGSSLYARGYDFDGGITLNLFEVTGVESPIKHYNRLRCIRTAIDELAGTNTGYTDTPKPEHMIPHHSLHDISWDIAELVVLQRRQQQFLKGVK